MRSRAGERWTGALVGAWLAVVALCACSNDLDALYRTAKSSADAAVSKTAEAGAPKEPPILPALPDPDRVAACEACAQDSCADARANCLEDDACTAQLACSGTCSDPGCLQRCQADYGAQGRWSIWWEDLFVCAYRTCATQCNTGQNWACSDHFDWPPVAERTIHVRARFGRWNFASRLAFGDAPAFTDLYGARVSVCASQNSCAFGAFDQATLDAAPGAMLKLPAPFRGYFEIERSEVRWRVHYLPITRSIEVFAGVASYYTPSQMFSIGWVPSEASALLWAYLLDCTMSPGRNLRVELPDQPQAKIAYESTSGVLDPAVERTTAPGSAVVPEVAVPPNGFVRVRAVRADGSQTVVERTLPMRNGWMTAVWLGPHASSDD